MWVYLIVGLISIYALYKERQALGCPSIPTGEDCDNQNGKAVRGTQPSSFDSNQDICLKLRRAGSYKDRFVFWRVAFLGGVVCAFILWFILYQRVPSERELVVLILVIFSVFYLIDEFYKFHLVDHVKRNVQESLDILQNRFRPYL